MCLPILRTKILYKMISIFSNKNGDYLHKKLKRINIRIKSSCYKRYIKPNFSSHYRPIAPDLFSDVPLKASSQKLDANLDPGGDGLPYIKDGDACHTFEGLKKQFWYLLGSSASEGPQCELL